MDLVEQYVLGSGNQSVNTNKIQYDLLFPDQKKNKSN